MTALDQAALSLLNKIPLRGKLFTGLLLMALAEGSHLFASKWVPEGVSSWTFDLAAALAGIGVVHKAVEAQANSNPVQVPPKSTQL